MMMMITQFSRMMKFYDTPQDTNFPLLLVLTGAMMKKEQLLHPFVFLPLISDHQTLTDLLYGKIASQKFCLLGPGIFQDNGVLKLQASI
jgi:hypothetical protein